MSVLENLRKLNKDVVLGNTSLQEAIELQLDPMNPEGVWGETIPKMEKLLNSPAFAELDEEDQEEVREMARSIVSFSPTSLVKGESKSSFLSEILEASGWGGAQDISDLYDKAVKNKDQFVAVMDYSKDGETAELKAEPRAFFSSDKLRSNEYMKLRVTGFDTGVAEDIFVKMKKAYSDEEFKQIYGEFDDLGNPRVNNVYSAILPGVGLVEVDKSNPEMGIVKVNNQEIDGNLIKSNPKTYHEAENYKRNLFQGIKSMVGENIDPGIESWVNNRVKNRKEQQLPEGVAGPVRSSLQDDLKKFKESPDYVRARSMQELVMPPQPYSRQSAGVPTQAPNKVPMGPLPPPPQAAAPTQAGSALDGMNGGQSGSGLGRLESAVNAATQGFNKFKEGFKRGY